jgi:hypothetical protein
MNVSNPPTTGMCQVEGAEQHRPYVISCELVSRKRWLIVGACIAPSETDGSTLAFISAVQMRRPEIPLILSGDLKVYLRAIEKGSQRSVEIAATVASLGVEDMSKHF